MRKKIMLLPCSVLAALTAYSQQAMQAVIAPAGDISKTANISLQWTLGEPVIESVVSNNYLLTQGFHQPLLQSKRRLPLVASPPELVSVQVMPNPLQHTCRVFITRQAGTMLYLELSDSHGRKLYTTTATGKIAAVTLDLTAYAAGTYLLSVRDAQGLLYNTSKLIKTQ
jgi:hypothetical protein